MLLDVSMRQQTFACPCFVSRDVTCILCVVKTCSQLVIMDSMGILIGS